MKTCKHLTYTREIQWRIRALWLLLTGMLVYMVLIAELGGGDSRMMTPLADKFSRIVFFGGLGYVIGRICKNKQLLRSRQLLQQQNTVNKLIMFSGNKVLDAIINSKSAAAERAGVRLSAIITIPLASISPEDITIILGNALDNAIRAAKDSQRKVVDIHIQPQGAYSSIVIANDIAHPVLSDNPALRTTKNIRYRHGFGIQNMRQAVERNQGLIRFYEQNDRFICDILLLNVQNRNE